MRGEREEADVMAMCVRDPTAEEAVATSHRAPRLSSLAGRTVGLLDNGTLRVHALLHDLETLLRTEHGVAEVLRFTKPEASRPMPPAVLAALHACDTVIVGVGD
jgi:hypothetical protein